MEARNIDKSSGLLRLAMVVLCVFFLTALTVGCDDDSSYDSKLEEARIAIDDAKYGLAIEILKGMDGAEVLEVLACAHAGLAGIDTFEILSEVGNDGSSGDGSIDLIGKMLGTGDTDTLTLAAIKTKLDEIDSAKDLLLESAGGDAANLDEDGKVKLAIYGLTDVILVMGKVISTTQGDGDVILTEAAIDGLDGTFVEADITDLSDADGVDYIAQINEDLDAVEAGVAVLCDGAETNDLSDEFAAFLDKIDSSDDGYISAAEFVGYLN